MVLVTHYSMMCIHIVELESHTTWECNEWIRWMDGWLTESTIHSQPASQQRTQFIWNCIFFSNKKVKKHYFVKFGLTTTTLLNDYIRQRECLKTDNVHETLLFVINAKYILIHILNHHP